ncbi:hypothetical protein [Moraxella bovoculi]|uniref:hypothetical protein n=1 Tax=Moraxella bovoculi TaxID=386891 RepID=UPI000624455E|nr:hypothetical protein [Moraxella bovoculi]AKG11486.1 hypothetical protein AAX07_05200 [Moraxella bovoculi]
MKKVQVNTPLILEQNGELVRIDTGSVIELPDDVYAEVSAHTTLLDDVSDEPVEPVSEPVFEPQPTPEVQAEPTPDEDATAVDETANDDTASDEVVTTETTKKSTRKKA